MRILLKCNNLKLIVNSTYLVNPPLNASIIKFLYHLFFDCSISNWFLALLFLSIRSLLSCICLLSFLAITFLRKMTFESRSELLTFSCLLIIFLCWWTGFLLIFLRSSLQSFLNSLFIYDILLHFLTFLKPYKWSWRIKELYFTLLNSCFKRLIKCCLSCMVK